jgi:hypothetical protein
LQGSSYQFSLRLKNFACDYISTKIPLWDDDKIEFTYPISTPIWVILFSLLDFCL